MTPTPELPPSGPRPPRAMAWVILLAAAGSVLAVGLVGTFLVFSRLASAPEPPGIRFWSALLVGCGLSVASVGLRSLRWIFLLRRAETRIPIRDAYIGYFAGLSLLFTPFLVGEIAVRAWIHRRRGNVPVHTTIVVNVWERLLDVTALAVIVVAAGFVNPAAEAWSAVLLGGVVLSLVTPFRSLVLTGVASATAPVARVFDGRAAAPLRRLADLRTWSVALATSVAVWLLPASGFWLLAGSGPHALGLLEAWHVYASSSVASATTLVPGGVLVVGRQILAVLLAHGYDEPTAALTVFGLRLSTAGVAVALGALFVLMHLRTAAAATATHFDDIADAYDVQIPESRRLALLEKKTGLMKAVIEERGAGRRGLDVGCGQGAYVGRMRELGFDVYGIDMSAGQVRLAARNVGADLVRVGSALDVPAADASFDFLYIINVLHHLPSVEEQRRAFRELFRVLKPGGLLFVHEINTRNILFRFYMSYVFPSLNCIDEGIERWLLPNELGTYTDAAVVEVRYFTFLPDFFPGPIVRMFAPIERWLERSSHRVYSAHYMAVLRK